MEIIPEKTALLFPGQGSQALGMGKELALSYPVSASIFAQADQILQIPLSKISWEGPTQELDDTLNTQPALFVHSIATLQAIYKRFPNFTPAFVAGHSMGELSALHAAGALSFESGLKLVRNRGVLMKEAGEINPGGMAAVIGLDIPSLEDICSQASRPGEIVQVANDNCPGQVVISGASPALDRAMQVAADSGARLVKKLAVSIAAHSPLMEHAQADFNQAVQETPFQEPSHPVIGNVNARPLKSIQAIMLDLQAQLTSRVRWTESIQYMISQGVDTFLEIGSGSVLIGLLRRIDRSVKGVSIGHPDDFEHLAHADRISSDAIPHRGGQGIAV